MTTPSPSASQPINVGIIGLSAGGGWASMAHYPSLSRLPELFAIKGLTAGSTASAKLAAEKYRVPFYSDNPAELAARDDIGLIVVTVGLPQHQALIEQIAPYGKAIYCEWPLGTTPEQSRALQQTAEKYGCRTFIGLQAPTSPYVRKIKALIDDPAAGRLLSCTVRGSDPTRGFIVDPRYLYAQQQKNGVNTLTIPFAHMLAALNLLTGRPPLERALTACLHPQVRRKDNGQTLRRTATDHVLYQARHTNGALTDVVYLGGGSGLAMQIECEHLSLVITANSGHIQYEPLTIEIIREGQSQTLPPHSTPAECLVETYRAVWHDLHHGTHTVPDFAYAAEHQQRVFDLAASPQP